MHFYFSFQFILRDRGATLANGATYGDTVANQRSFTVNGKLNLENLYNKVDFLKETNKKFASSKGKSSTRKKTAMKSSPTPTSPTIKEKESSVKQRLIAL